MGAKSEAIRKSAVLALLTEKTVTDAATKAKVDESTLRRWLSEDAAFQAAHADARQAAFQAGISRVQALTARAVDTLEDLLDATDHPNVRLGAARTVAELGIHQHDADTILRKLNEIESSNTPTTPASSQPDVPSIAVLPFDDMSPGKDQDYFCEGMAEEIINALTTLDGLHVASRTSAFLAKEKRFDIAEIGRSLRVEAVLEGSVRKAGNRLRMRRPTRTWRWRSS